MKHTKLNCYRCIHADACIGGGIDSQIVQQFQTLVKRPPLLTRGEYLFNAAENMEALYAVSSGSLKLSLPTVEGGERVLGFYLPGDIVGFDGLSEGIHTCNAVALETTGVCRIPLESFMELCTAHPSLSSAFHRLMGFEMQRAHALCAVLDKKSAEQRVAHFLVDLSGRFAHRGMSSSDFYLSMSRYDIADYLGLATETVSRAFKRLQEDALIAVERRLIHILDLSALTQLVHEAPAETPVKFVRNSVHSQQTTMQDSAIAA